MTKIACGSTIDAASARDLIRAYCTEPDIAVSVNGDLPSPYTTAAEIAADIEDGDTSTLHTGFYQPTFLVGESNGLPVHIEIYGLKADIDYEDGDEDGFVAVPRAAGA